LREALFHNERFGVGCPIVDRALLESVGRFFEAYAQLLITVELIGGMVTLPIAEILPFRDADACCFDGKTKS